MAEMLCCNQGKMENRRTTTGTWKQKAANYPSILGHLGIHTLENQDAGGKTERRHNNPQLNIMDVDACLAHSCSDGLPISDFCMPTSMRVGSQNILVVEIKIITIIAWESVESLQKIAVYSLPSWRRNNYLSKLLGSRPKSEILRETQKKIKGSPPIRNYGKRIADWQRIGYKNPHPWEIHQRDKWENPSITGGFNVNL
jgi:hypothetical protein